jgi:hypothetical protein
MIFYIAFLLSSQFSFAQNRYGVLITEFLPDPSPVVALPGSSFVEINNRSGKDIHLLNWTIGNSSSSATIKSDYLLKADSFLILCPAASAMAYAVFGPSLGVAGFPALDNDAGDIILRSDTGAVIHAIHYDKSWYDNDVKSQGGWSLEIIDMTNPCGRKNWTASISPLGGTPGKKNSVDRENPDTEPPALQQAVATDSLDLVLLFDEPLDSLSASSSSNFLISDGIGTPETAESLTPFFDHVAVHLQRPLSTGKWYTISVQQIADCSGNEIGVRSTCKAGIPEKAKSSDIVFNEILFNPAPGGYDYLELYNRSSKVISCSDLFIAGKNMDGSLKDPVALVKEDRAFFPGEYLLLTENTSWLLNNYPSAPAAQLIDLPALPSLPDDLGKVVLLNDSGDLLDELDYDHHWHSPLLANESGVSLERISPDLPTSQASNWTSAAAPAGYGTPGYKNSEFSMDSTSADFISVEPKIFSPDMDGYHDFCFINYHLPSAGFIGSITIYNVLGRMVRQLVNNTIWATDGNYRWDGLDDQQNPLPMGHYILYVELFLPDGTVKKQTLVCVLARGKRN